MSENQKSSTQTHDAEGPRDQRLVRLALRKFADYEEDRLGWGRPMLDHEPDLPETNEDARKMIDAHVVHMHEALEAAKRDLERKALEIKSKFLA